MMDRERRHNGVEGAPRVGQWIIEVVLDHLDLVDIVKSLVRRFEHLGREVGCHCGDVWMHLADDADDVPVPGPEVEHAPNGCREELEHGVVTLVAVRDVAPALQVVAGVRGIGPEIDGSSTHGPTVRSRGC